MRPTTIARFEYKPVILRLPDGTLQAVFPRCDKNIAAADAPYVMHEVGARSSSDNGHTWSNERTLYRLPTTGGGWWGVEGIEAFLDDQGETHLFFLNDARTGVVPSAESSGATTGGEAERPAASSLHGMRLDIWHTKSTGGRKSWSPLRCIWRGYTGALNSVIQMRNGRILLPFSFLTNRHWGGDRGGGLYQFTFTGQYDCTLLYSDDHGATWKLSPAALKVVVPDIVSAYGAVEPVVIELSDGRVWMVIRTQLGRFYESFSRDGIAWSVPQPTSILSSDSPPGIVKLGDGRIVLFWNNCLRYPYAYGGRQVLHAAISEDDGHTWHGYREVLRDPLANEPPPPTGDHGTGYPFPMVANENKIILSSGQGPERKRYACVLVDPTWLYEKHQEDDFARGLDDWSVFGTKGAEIATHPNKPHARVLAIRRMDDWPTVAAWNFPAGHRGRLHLKLLVKCDRGCAHLGLTDHFSVPFDTEDRFHNLFNLQMGTGGIRIPAERWINLELGWDCAKHNCIVSMEGKEVSTLMQQHASAGGPCYLRLASGEYQADDAGFLVESVRADVR